MMVGLLPADVSLLAGVGVGLLLALQLLVWFDLPKGRPPVAPTPLSEMIAALVELDQAHAEALSKAGVAANAKAEADTAAAGAAAKHQQLSQRLAAAYPVPQAPAAPAAPPQP